jgi:hypothetical protein
VFAYDRTGVLASDRALTAHRPSRGGGRSAVPESLQRTEPGLPRVLGNGSLAALATAAAPATLWRCGPVPCDCPADKRAAASAGLTVSDPSDPAEREAERVADHVMRTAEQVPLDPGHTVHSGDSSRGGPATAIDGTFGGGQPIAADAREFMEARFGRKLDTVRIHTDANAGELARQVSAKAFTVRDHVFFAAGEYRPNETSGRRLLAHELTHVAQQGGSVQTDGAPTAYRQMGESASSDADLAAEREYGDKGAPKATTCGSPSWCPAGFCSPYRSEELAKYYRSKNAPWLLAGISAAVDSRVVPLWREYVWGGSPPKDLTAEFGADFTASPTTRQTTTFLRNELQARLTASPPFVARSGRVSLDIAGLIPGAIAELGDPAAVHQMNFNKPRDVPGNLAGGIGTDQKACPAGAQPSPFNDERHAHGTVELDRGSDRQVTVTPAIRYTVKDTIDLCPGDCGAPLEQIATVPLSQFEATGISGDVPFTVEFPAPVLGSFTITAPDGPEPAPTPLPSPKPKATGETP